jgi:mono/diheme cytochrome c family protein
MRQVALPRALAALAAAALAVGLAACGDDGDETTSELPTVQTEEPNAEKPKPEKPKGGGAELTGAAAEGQEVFSDNGCGGCHALSGREGTGPGLGGVYNSNVRLTNHTSVRATTEYLKKSINTPDSDVVDGYDSGIMTTAVPPNSLSAADVDALVAYIKTLK